MREVKTPPDQPAVAEQLLYLVRVRVGRDVEILRVQAEQQVAYGATHEERLVAGFFEPIQHFQGIGRDIGARDRMLVARHHSGGARIIDDPGRGVLIVQ